MSTRGFGGFGRQSTSPQEQKYLSFSRSGIRASGGSSAGKRSSRRSLSTSDSVIAAVAAASTSASTSRIENSSAMDTVTPATQRTRYVMRTSGKKTHSRKHVRASDTMTDASASLDGSANSASVMTDITEGDTEVCQQSQQRITELEHALEESNKARDEAVALAEERQKQIESLQKETEALKQRYFNALCLAVKLDTLRDDKKSSSSSQALGVDSQQELYDLAKEEGIRFEDYPHWVANNIGTKNK